MGFLTDISDKIGLTDSKAGDRASRAQAEAMEEANRIQREMYAEAKGRFADTEKRYSDYQREGNASFGDLVNMARNTQNFSNAENPLRNHSGVFGVEDFKQDPGYQFRMQEGLKALNRGASAQGNFGSGGALKELARYGQNFASNEYQNAYNRFNNDYQNSYNRYNQDDARKYSRIGDISNYGLNANNQITNASNNLGNAQMSMSNSMSQNAIGMGNANAANEMQRGQAMKDLWNMGMQAGGMAMGMPSMGK